MATPGEKFREVWTAAFKNQLDDFMKKSAKLTISGPGWASISQGGLTISLPRQKPATGGVSAPAPWLPFLTQDVSGNYQANFFQGTAGGILPSGLTGIALTQSAINYLYLAMTASAGVVTGATITASVSYPALAPATSATPPATFNIPVAIFDLTPTKPVATNIVGFGNIWAQPYVTILDTINTGALLTAPFTPWFNWEWGASG